MPGRRVARRQIGLGAGRVVARRGIDLRVGLGARASARRGGRAALAAAVVQRAHHDRLVDVVVQKTHQHLLADARHEADAHARARLALRHPHPAAGRLALGGVGLPMETDAHVAALVAQDLVLLFHLRAALGVGHDRRVHPVHRRRAAQARAALMRQLRPPRPVAAHRFEAVGVAHLARLGQYRRIGGLRSRGLAIQHQIRIQPPQPLRQRSMGFRRQVVDAHMLDPVQRKDGLEADLARRPQRRQVPQREARARAERAHHPAARESLGAGAHGLARQVRLPAGLRLVGKAAMAGDLVPVQARRVVLPAGRVDRRLRGHGALAAVVPAQHGDAVGRAAALARQRLHGVARFGRRGALEADAAARGLGVLGQVAAVGEQLHHVARGHAFVFQHGPAQAGLGQQAHQEVIVGFTVLGGVGTRRQVGQRAFDVGRDAVDIALIAVEHMAHDVQHGLALEHAAGAPLRRQPQPRHDGQPVARQAGVARQQLSLADHAAARRAAAVGARGPQRDRARDHVLQRQAGVIRQRHHAQLADAGKRLARDPALHLQ
ncbi:Uncharacterised protein [Achromobacter sp. 2789STDY5608628]|nr:Uncharacterised protein [Achromobacter sp. 2789STDY5608628]